MKLEYTKEQLEKAGKEALEKEDSKTKRGKDAAKEIGVILTKYNVELKTTIQAK